MTTSAPRGPPSGGGQGLKGAIPGQSVKCYGVRPGALGAQNRGPEPLPTAWAGVHLGSQGQQVGAW